jgi:hypothetical protein
MMNTRIFNILQAFGSSVLCRMVAFGGTENQLAESKTGKTKKAGPNGPALIERDSDRFPGHHLSVEDFPTK